MNSKKAITLLVLLSMLFAMVPSVPMASAALDKNAIDVTNDDTGVTVPDAGPPALTIDDGEGQKGDLIMVVGDADSVASGYEVKVYWDSIQTWNGVKGLLNTTAVDDDGGFEIWFNVPESVVGAHQIWITATDQSTTARIEFTVLPLVKVSSSSGLDGDKVDTTAYGFNKEKDAAVFFVEDADFLAGVAAWDWDQSPAAEVVGNGATEQQFEDTLEFAPIEPGSLVISDAGAAHDILDDGAGSLYSDEDDSGTINAGDLKVGTINYILGEYDIDYDDAGTAATGAITAAYNGYNAGTANTLYLITTSGDTSSLGSYSKRITIPDGNAVDYYVVVMDAKGELEGAEFTIGAVISLSADSGKTGMILTIEGRGFDNVGPGEILQQIPNQVGPVSGVMLTDGAANQMVCTILDYDAANPPQVDGDGEFSIQVFVPNMDDKDDFEIHVCDGVEYATADFELTALPEITVDPDYGPQGSRVTVTGENFPAQKEIELSLELHDAYDRAAPVGSWVADIEEVETDSDGKFTTTVRVPTQPDDTYDMVAIYYSAANVVNIDAAATFRVGTVLVLLSDDTGEAGKNIVLTGNGFTANQKWNATFGDETIFDDGDVSATGLLEDGGLTPEFFVPQVEPGVYDIMVLDIDTGIEVVVEFEVTAATTVEIDPSQAPTQYNISISGYNWMEDTGAWDFILFNDTEEWDMSQDILQWPLGHANHGVLGLADGTEWHAWFYLTDDGQGDLSKGTYTMNITQDDDFFYQLEIVVGDEHVSVAPRKSTFRIGDTVSFNVQHSFGDVAPVLNGDIRVFDPSGNLYWDGDALGIWTKVGMYYTAPVSAQTAGGNPMVLLDDAPLGTWTYEWREAGANPDTIEEGTFVVAAAEADVISDQVTDLNNKITDLADQLTDVTTEFSDVKSDIADVAAIAEQAVTAAQAAAEAVQTVAQTANTASQAAADAAEAATAAKDAANGLTTLVYGAIGAALVAALAAIVSLMQISKKIAG